MTQQQPPVPQTQEHPDAFKAVEKSPAEWWRQLEAIMRPKEEVRP